MATIITRKTTDGHTSYIVRIRRKGYPSHTATFHSRTDAKKWAQVTEGAVLEGRHFPTAEAKRHTLADLIDRYIQDVLPHKSKNHRTMRQIQLRWWKSHLGHTTLVHVTPSLIADYRDKLRPRSNATVVRYMAALSHVFSIAVKEWQWIDDNPFLKVSKPKESRGRVRFLSDDERQRLLTVCKRSRNRHLYMIVVLALSTGARKMELLTLRWRDIDLQGGRMVLQETKNGERRVLPLTDHALDLLQKYAKVRRIDTDLLFPGRDGAKPRYIETPWRTAVRRANITDFRFHDLRHSAASYLAMNGASLMELAEIFGHKTLSMVKRYTHLSDHIPVVWSSG